MDAPRFALASGAQRPPSLSLVLPALNEEATISQSIREADEALSKLTSDYEILVVDDGCTDNTAAIVERESRTRSSVRLLRQPKNLGYGAALARGFREARMDLVSFSDSDCQFDLNELNRLLFLARDYDIVCGYRIDRQDPWMRKVYSRVYNLIVRNLLGTRVRDVDCAMKVFHRDVIQGISIETRGFFVNSEVLTKARLQNRSVVEVGVTHRARAAGESTVSPLHTIPVLGSIVRFWWNTVLFPQTALSASTTSLATDRSAAVVAGLRSEWAGLLLLLLICCGMLLPNLSYPLIEPDESRYVQIAIEMVQTGDVVTPRLNGEPYLDKPPLLYWMTASSMSLLGVNETAARLPTVLAAMFTVLLTFWVGKRVVGSMAAWCGAVSLLLCGGFVLAGRFVVMDALLTCCTTLCFLSGYLAIASGRINWRWWLVTSVAFGFGVLTKGPVALVLCLPPLLAIPWLSGEKRLLRLGHWAVLGGVVALMVAPWFIAVAAANPEFLSHFIVKHNLSRFTSGFNHIQPVWFYLPVVMAGMFPASLLLPVLSVFLFGRSEAYRKHRTRDLGFLLLGAVWVVGFFSLSSCKLATYILPAMPLICLLLGSMLEHFVIKPQQHNQITSYLQTFPRRASAIAIAVGAIVGVVNCHLSGDTDWTSLTAVAICGLAAIGLACYWKHEITSSLVGWSGTAVVSAAVVVLVFSDLVPEVATSRSVLRHAAVARGSDLARTVVYFGSDSHAASMMLPSQSVVEIDGDDLPSLERFLDQNPHAVLVTSDHSFSVLEKSVSATSTLVPSGGRNHVHVVAPRIASAIRVATKPASQSH